MLKKAENYEEAKILVRRRANDKAVTGLAFLLSVLQTGFMAAIAAAGLGIAGISFSLMPPIFAILAGISFVPFIKYLKEIKRIRNGEFFVEKSQSEVMELADKYVTWKNKRERKEEIKVK